MKQVYSKKQIEVIAAAGHEAIREYCASIGDDSQVPWADAPKWQKASARGMAMDILNNPNMTPLNTHQNWLAVKAADGWVYGEVKDAKAKTHPCMVDYDQLPEEQRDKDAIFIRVVLNHKLSIDNPPTPVNEVGGAAGLDGLEGETVSVVADGNDGAPMALPPIKLSIREHTTLLRNRLETVMSQSGKRPGDLRAFSAGLAEMAQFEHPLMDVTD